MIIYKFYSKQWNLLYIGRTINDLKARIKNHFSANEYEKWKDRVKYVSSSYVGNITELYLYEIYLISMENPQFNKEFSGFEKPWFSLPPLRFSKLIDVEKFGITKDERLRLLQLYEMKNKTQEYSASELQKKIDEAMEDFHL